MTKEIYYYGLYVPRACAHTDVYVDISSGKGGRGHVLGNLPINAIERARERLACGSCY